MFPLTKQSLDKDEAEVLSNILLSEIQVFQTVLEMLKASEDQSKHGWRGTLCFIRTRVVNGGFGRCLSLQCTEMTAELKGWSSPGPINLLEWKKLLQAGSSFMQKALPHEITVVQELTKLWNNHIVAFNLESTTINVNVIQYSDVQPQEGALVERSPQTIKRTNKDQFYAPNQANGSGKGPHMDASTKNTGVTTVTKLNIGKGLTYSACSCALENVLERTLTEMPGAGMTVCHGGIANSTNTHSVKDAMVPTLNGLSVVMFGDSKTADCNYPALLQSGWQIFGGITVDPSTRCCFPTITPAMVNYWRLQSELPRKVWGSK